MYYIMQEIAIGKNGGFQLIKTSAIIDVNSLTMKFSSILTFTSVNNCP